MNPLFARLVFCCVALSFTSGCASFTSGYNNNGDVILSAQDFEPTETNKKLLSLPEPDGRITVAVYGFRDLTGQNKPAPASGLSTAVTQGAENVLIKALLESRWFNPVERASLQNLVTERDLWRQSMAASGQANGLPALPPASVLLEGGIVGYDFNLRTGGSGAKYLGIGGSQTYREDVLTVALRAINARDGQIIHSITTQKTVFSRAVNTGAFGFLSFDELAEIEAGYAYNESIQLSVTDAIETAVIKLVLEGIERGSWRPAETQNLSLNEPDDNTSADIEAATGDSPDPARSIDPSEIPEFEQYYPIPPLNPTSKDVSEENAEVASEQALGQGSVGQISDTNVTTPAASSVEDVQKADDKKIEQPERVPDEPDAPDDLAETQNDAENQTGAPSVSSKAPVPAGPTDALVADPPAGEGSAGPMPGATESAASNPVSPQLVDDPGTENPAPVSGDASKRESDTISGVPADINRTDEQLPAETDAAVEQADVAEQESGSLLAFGRYQTPTEAATVVFELKQRLDEKFDVNVSQDVSQDGYFIVAGPVRTDEDFEAIVSVLRESGFSEVTVIDGLQND
ncbi:MAG: CsgG/HfaB family protein [Granulosicoccus sp.]